MGLEGKFEERRKRVVVRRVPNEDIREQIERGNKFIIVQDDFDFDSIPEGYTLIDMRHRGEPFRTLIPQSLLFYMANPGEGNPNNALDEIADFYGEAEDFEDDLIEEGRTNVQEANWATLARGSYGTYLVNRLVKHKKGARDEEGEPVPEFNSSVISELHLGRDYVQQRIKAIAALALGKTADQVNVHEIRDVIKHITVRERRTEQLTREEFDKITCWAGSHYEIKPEYQNTKDNYDIDRVHSRSHKVGTKIIPAERALVLDSKITELENEIEEFRRRSGAVGRHDRALIRQYINLAYIASENPRAQLDIQPPENRGGGEK